MRLRFGMAAWLASAVAMTCPTIGGQQARAQWPQWGGPSRDFTSEATGLADSWPDKGPKRLWKKKLGEGFSSIVADDGLLYTMYRRGKRFEYTVALDAETGKKVWQQRSPSPVPEEGEQFPGPHSTPLVAGDRLFSVGRGAHLQCFDKKTGDSHWSHDLAAEYGCSFSSWGYSCSPIAYDDTVIVPVGRKRPPFPQQAASGQEQQASAGSEEAEGRTLMAFAQQDGKVVWKSQDFGVDHASPILVNLNGREQLVLVTPEALFAVDPSSGELLWQHGFEDIEGYMTTPIWMEGNLLLCSTPRSGSRVFELTEQDGVTVPRPRWQSSQFRLTFLNGVRVGDCIVGASGSNPATFVCVDAQTGERNWVSRDVSGATMLSADGKLIILTEDGELVLATATPEGLTVHSRHQIAEKEAFSAPTLIGTTLYVRDRKNIMAFDLG